MINLRVNLRMNYLWKVRPRSTSNELNNILLRSCECYHNKKHPTIYNLIKIQFTVKLKCGDNSNEFITLF